MSKRVVLAMSGGVDSSAAALLLQQQGYEVIGLFMRSGETDEVACEITDPTQLPIVNVKPHKQGCCSASDAADARRVADRLDIPFHALNFKDAFGRIKDYFADEYLAGRTPNPCIMCNNWLKFGKLWDFAKKVDAQFIATGHYARLDQSETPPALYRGDDMSKDQSYVLFGVDPSLLGKILFPVGDMKKSAIRELSRQAGIATADKPDSQEICFIPNNNYSEFIERYKGKQETAGELVDTEGNVVGQHAGFQNYTIGQRKGLGAFDGPRFVLKIEPESRRVVIGTREQLGKTRLIADRTNWLLSDLPLQFDCKAQIRYQQPEAECTVLRNTENDEIEVQFKLPQFGVAPGQAVVLYDSGRVLGGGWIREAIEDSK